MKKMTPLMKQYWEMKSAHSDKILLFRMGDFFEMFHDDAATAAPLLDITLTKRNKKAEDTTLMCGVPHHSVAGPINKLLSLGFKVAICDQIEDPKEAKGLVKRAVTRILSPGMIYDPDTLDETSTHYICAFDESTVSFLETTTGEAFYYPLSEMRQLENLIQIIAPKELVVTEEQAASLLENKKLSGPYISKFSEVREVNSDWPLSANRLASYASYMQGDEILQLVSGFEPRKLNKRLELSPTTVRHLEIFQNSRGDKKGSLIQAISRTKSSIGSRRLRQWLRFPLTDVEEIERRLDEVGFWMSDPQLLEEVRGELAKLGDIERRLGKASNPQFNARDLLALGQSLQTGLEISRKLPHVMKRKTHRLESLKVAEQLLFEIQRSIVEEPPATMKAGGFVQRGLRPDLDELIVLSTEGQRTLRELEAREREVTGIPSLKVRYNGVFGYFIEVTNTHKDKVPAHYMRKQTLTNAERYITEELNLLEEKILSAKTRRTELELEVFEQIKNKVLEASPKLLDLALVWSEIDVFSSLAWLAIENNYVRPSFSKEGDLHLQASRHPVVEQEVSQRFVPNDLNIKAHHCLMLTGPNMAGKSTLMRQVAIAAVLAQTGSYVPAQNAVLPVFENIYTRIGASDFLSEGLSTFMVEMMETAEMLTNTNKKCLVILDEVGRGTSTYDGMSLAQSILEYLLQKKKSMTLFATHYHELTEMAAQFPQITNGHMTISERQGEIHFLHTLQMGAASKSYGIEVAKLAGLPVSVTKRAGDVLKELECNHGNRQMNLLDYSEREESAFKDSNGNEYEELIEELREYSLQSVTPLDALNKIASWQKTLS